MGGEPLLYPRLIDFLRLNREVGIAELVTLATSGVLMHRQPTEMWKFIDKIVDGWR